MSLNDTVSAERVHIGFFGLRNAGKSSVVNAVTNQDLAVVSDVKGTTTDPVKKAMEILPLGPCLIIDTPGIDDEGELGEKRIKKAKNMLAEVDIAILVVDSNRGLTELDEELVKTFKEKNISYIIAYNKADLLKERKQLDEHSIYVSAVTKENINELKNKLATFMKKGRPDNYVIRDLLNKDDLVVLVVPIDESAPKGRLILPQQLVIRDILDANCAMAICQHTELQATLDKLSKKPKMVVTDSQVFEYVKNVVPNDIMLTSFSILFARYRGDLAELVKGAKKLEKLKDGDLVFVSEACTHHRQCNDIGTVKLPKMIENFSKAKPKFFWTQGTEFPENLSECKLVVHCGGCMINENEMLNRIKKAVDAHVPIVNYGIAMSHMQGILKRTLEPFKDIESLLQ